MNGLCHFGLAYTPHFIYCHTELLYPDAFENLKEKFLKKMKKYGIWNGGILTTLYMRRRILITNEKSKEAAEGKLKNEPIWEDYEGSINEDLESFINNLHNSNEISDEEVRSFFMPKLTNEELKLVEEKNKQHMMTYWLGFGADVDVEEMERSDSTAKFVHSSCLRKTVRLTLKSE